MPDAKQRAQDALEHIELFERGAWADVKAELRKIAGDDGQEPDGGAPASPAAAAKLSKPAADGS